MKNILKIISIVSIIAFAILWGLNKFSVQVGFNSVDIRSILVLVYLYTSLKYHQMEVRDKDREITELKEKLAKGSISE